MSNLSQISCIDKRSFFCCFSSWVQYILVIFRGAACDLIFQFWLINHKNKIKDKFLLRNHKDIFIEEILI